MENRDVGQDSQDPEDGLHPLEKGAYGEKNDPLRPFHESHCARDLDGFCLCPHVGNEDRADRYYESEDNESRVLISQIMNGKGQEEEEIRVSIQDGIQEATEGCDLSQLSGDDPIEKVEEPGKDDHHSRTQPEFFQDEERCHEGCEEAHHGERIRIPSLPEEGAKELVEERIESMSNLVANHFSSRERKFAIEHNIFGRKVNALGNASRKRGEDRVVGQDFLRHLCPIPLNFDGRGRRYRIVVTNQLWVSGVVPRGCL